MDRLYVRTCSSDQAFVLARADGKSTRVRTSRVRIHRPTGRLPIDPNSQARYIATVEVLDVKSPPGGTAEGEAAQVVAELFGPYLD